MVLPLHLALAGVGAAQDCAGLEGPIRLYTLEASLHFLSAGGGGGEALHWPQAPGRCCVLRLLLGISSDRRDLLCVFVPRCCFCLLFFELFRRNYQERD